MVFGLKPMRKLITLDKYLNVRQNKGLVWILEPQTYKEICIKGLTLFCYPFNKRRALGMLGRLDFLLRVKQSLGRAWVLGPDAWEKHTLRRHYKCRTYP